MINVKIPKISGLIHIGRSLKMIEQAFSLLTLNKFEGFFVCWFCFGFLNGKNIQVTFKENVLLKNHLNG